MVIVGLLLGSAGCGNEGHTAAAPFVTASADAPSPSPSATPAALPSLAPTPSATTPTTKPSTAAPKKSPTKTAPVNLAGDCNVVEELAEYVGSRFGEMLKDVAGGYHVSAATKAQLIADKATLAASQIGHSELKTFANEIRQRATTLRQGLLATDDLSAAMTLLTDFREAVVKLAVKYDPICPG